MFKRTRSTDDFAEEIKAHLELEAEELRREGLSDDEARRRAYIAFGNVGAAQERFYLRDRMVWFDNRMRDIRFAIRQLIKNPGFTTTAILVLALGIGASVATFGFVDAALLETLPYTNPSQLMSVNESSDESPRWPLSYPDYLDWQRMNHSFSSLDVYNNTGYILNTSSGAEPVQAERVSGGFFQTLGVQPMLGRDFYPGENRPGGPNVLLLSYGAWLHRFGARSDAVGQTVDLDDRAFTVIGVLPRGFSFAPAGSAEFWVPLNSFSDHEKMRGFYTFWGIGRLRPGVTAQAALAEMNPIAKQLQRQYGITGLDLSANVVPLTEVIVGDVRPILLTLLGGAILLLLIAYVNVGSLVLVRSESRRREVAIRGALGATQARLAEQFVTEGLLLGLLGSLAGMMVAAGIMKLLGSLVPKGMASKMPFLGDVGLNPHTVAFGAAVATLAVLLLAVTPTLRLSSLKVREEMADGDRGSGTRLWRRLGANLVVVELVIAVVLLAGAGLLGRSLYRLLHVPLGFDPNHLATMSVMAPGTTYKNDEQVIGLYREIVGRLSSLPGLKTAGLTSMLPVQCNCATDRIHFPGRPDHGEHNEVDERHVSPGYLPTLKAALLRGRYFTEADDPSHPRVAVINQALARKYFPNQDPIGQRIANDESGRPSVWEIVGVVDDVREGPLDVESWPAEYFPINQTRQNGFSLVVRTSQDAGSMLPVLVNTLHQIDPNLAISNETTMTGKIGATQAALLHRSSAWLVGGFAAIALILGVVGLYGVIAYSVSQRTREIGVRMALGAQRSSVYTLVMRQAGWLTATGLTIGLICSVGSSLLIRSLLFGVEAWDALTLSLVALLLAAASMTASFLPARRAASVNPVEALRAE
ncbi:ABC transporter permease [Granulicella sp. dw_53]|uniref:ABC transporter permease n=1 Tax=Granulicella sp. dw_53 TaxID=2719792 RepID=UPI001BD6C759|nr:ABC transporter permease [Granulicella sp. dw_53]